MSDNGRLASIEGIKNLAPNLEQLLLKRTGLQDKADQPCLQPLSILGNTLTTVDLTGTGVLGGVSLNVFDLLPDVTVIGAGKVKSVKGVKLAAAQAGQKVNDSINKGLNAMGKKLGGLFGSKKKK